MLVEELPGVEVISEGFDPRAPILVDVIALESPEGQVLQLPRIIVYQRNAERMVPDPSMVDAALQSFFEEELERFPNSPESPNG